jgi:phytoene desaturase
MVSRRSEFYGTATGVRSLAIVGGGLGGLSAAIHLRLAGYAVELFEANHRVGGRAGRIEERGFRFDTGPSLLNYPWIFKELFAAAGRSMDDYVTLLKLDPSVQFRWRDGTVFTLSSQLETLIEECNRLDPGSAPGLLAFMADASIKYRTAFDKLVNRNVDSVWSWFGGLTAREMASLSLWRSLYSELGRFFRSRYIREALGAYAMYLGGSPHELPGFFSMLPYGELAYGLWLPKGGIYGLVEGIERLALELGVCIHTGRPVRRILIADHAVQGLEFQDGDTRQFSLVVSNVDVPTTDTQLISGNGLGRALQAQTRKTRMTCGVITYYWGIRGKVVGLGHHSIFLPNDYKAAFVDLNQRKRIPRELPFYVSIPSQTDPDLAPSGDTALFVLVPTPLISEMPGFDWNAAVGDVKAQVLARLASHGCTINPSDIVVEHVYTPIDWRDRFGLYDGSAFGSAHTLFQVGPFRSPNYRPDISGLYYTGASTTPGTGMPMVVLGGRLTAERVIAHAR